MRVIPLSAVCRCTMVRVVCVGLLQSVFHCMPSSAGWSHSRAWQVAIKPLVTFQFVSISLLSFMFVTSACLFHVCFVTRASICLVVWFTITQGRSCNVPSSS